MREVWTFNEGDKPLVFFSIKDDKCMSSWFVDDFPFERVLIYHLCVGLQEDLCDRNASFSKLKKYYINDFHFEKREVWEQ